MIDAKQANEKLEGTRQMPRRLWLQGAVCGVGLPILALVVPASPMAQDTQNQRLKDAARAMSAVTGVELPEYWLQQTTPLVGLILDYSVELRRLDMGDLEPATYFVAR